MVVDTCASFGRSAMSSIAAPITQVDPEGELTARQHRRIMIDMCLRRQKPGTGTDSLALRERTAVNPWPDLRGVLRGIPWVVAGGVATRAYMPERATRDLDILIRAADGDAVLARLQNAGCKFISALGIRGYVLHSPEGVEIDVLLGDAPWLEEALTQVGHDAAGLPVLALPYLVLMKLTAMRSQDWADVSRMLGLATEPELAQVRDVVRRYSPEDMEDLEALIVLGQREAQLPDA